MKRREFVKITALAGATGAAAYTGAGALGGGDGGDADAAEVDGSTNTTATQSSTSSPSPTQSSTSTSTVTPTETETATDTPTSTPTEMPTSTATESSTPTATQSPTPTATATPAPEENIEIKAYNWHDGVRAQVYNYNDYRVNVEVEGWWEFGDGTEKTDREDGEIGPYTDTEMYFSTNYSGTIVARGARLVSVTRQ